jgi:hypothetical protein
MGCRQNRRPPRRSPALHHPAPARPPLWHQRERDPLSLSDQIHPMGCPCPRCAPAHRRPRVRLTPVALATCLSIPAWAAIYALVRILFHVLKH